MSIKKRIFCLFLAGLILYPALSGLIAYGSEQTARTVTEDILSSHIVAESVANPDGVTVNLFDYWVNTQKPSAATKGDILTKDHNHGREDGSSAGFSSQNDWNRGINAGHLLLFGDGIIHGGLWNKGAGENTNYGKKYAGMEGIVSPLLVNQYPVINTAAARQMLTGDKDDRDWELIKDYKLSGDHVDGGYTGDAIQNLSNTVIGTWGKDIENDTESLAYLFDPSLANPYKTSYNNVKGLFQLDEEGYYYYNMRRNFAEFQNVPEGDSDGHFVLYDAPATIRTDAEKSVGNFFPFNTGAEVFSGIDADGNLTSDVACFNNEMNHHLGMSINLDFRQTTNGMVNMGTQNKPMTFGFSGDDDVWVFIDGVLVLDLGGVHSEIYGTIDFSTGDVYIGRGFDTKGIPENPADPDNMVTHTTLKDIFSAAGQEDSVNWKENTFASNSDHTLQMFYLERGNYDSSLALRFNLQPQLYQQIKKVDQYGSPIEGVKFDLYEAEKSGEGAEAVYQPKGAAVAALTTGKDGVAQFEELDVNGEPFPFNFADRFENRGIRYYVLKETVTPVGYRALPIDIVLEYEHATSLIRVVSRWTTGSYASFVSSITGNSDITYGQFDPADGTIYPTEGAVDRNTQKNGLVVAIPMVYAQEVNKWRALYGSNISGQHAIEPQDREVVSWRKAALKAVLYQCSNDDERTPDWYLTWSDENKRLEGTLSDLPGRADRYQLTNKDGDMRMVYAIIDPKVFEELVIEEALESGDRYDALGKFVRDKMEAGLSYDAAVEAAVEEIYGVAGANGRGFSFLNVDQFNRNFRALIYIPNEQRELRVLKVDQDGNQVNGSVFGLYRVLDEEDEQNGTLAAQGVTANVDGQDGVLIFRPDVPKNEAGEAMAGYAEIGWSMDECDRYILKEISAPEGYRINETPIPIVVGTYSIYADAGTPDNGVTVMAGVGKLVQTMVKYAADEEVNITLRDITAYAQKQESGNYQGLDAWQDVKLEGTDVLRAMNLHYGKNAVIDYGLHNEDGGKTLYPFFVTDSGFLRARVRQNYAGLTGEMYAGEGSNNTANKEDIRDVDITSLFSLINYVVVTDHTADETNTGSLTVSKKVVGNTREGDYTKNFEFSIRLLNTDGESLDGEYYFYGTDKSGYIRSGGTIPLHHDESITILGLPAGTRYIVAEKESEGWYTLPPAHQVTGQIIKDETAEAAFINSRDELKEKPGNLTVSKAVTGAAGDTAKEFAFHIILKDESGTDLTDGYSYSGSKSGTVKSGDTITLKHNERITIEGLPAGTKYSVTEVEANQNGYITESTGSEGTIEADQTAVAAFTNRRDTVPPGTGHLSVSKTVTGTGSTTTDFHFTLTLDNTGINGAYGDMEFIDGVAVFTLRHGETKTAEGLPEGTGYAVTEEEANLNGYTTEVIGSEGKIERDTTVTVRFTNDKRGTEPLPSTGDVQWDFPWILLLILSFGILNIALWRRRALSGSGKYR